eukprot:CAMPEP_0201976864 /NCGR_PEP_ID=MMETSP0904-20121228/58744_1 /ASSEMBLY_ACC=CAM_ASM_000553 /TAXON_ID=420261 /ORGANISM="Thalassiosira antarctica, Strain CCMP982" /LENGTH=87 /DNA_ID=CAMNT_0048528085 /DNA_START=295 /DNA_END=559 /DNA_ORIENTATION=+
MAVSNANNETFHISLGNTTNHITSQLLNLQGQGLASTTHNSDSAGGSSHGDEEAMTAALCDPSVTHDITSLDSNYYLSREATASRYV